MEPMSAILLGAVALLLGAVVGWLIARQQLLRQQAQFGTERATHLERLEGLERECQSASARANAAETRHTELQADRSKLDSERAAAVQRAEGAESRIKELQADLSKRDEALIARASELAALRESLGRVETTLTQERKAIAEKVATWESAEAKLSQAFRALAAEALNQSNAAFLDLAKTRFDQSRVEAQGDLDSRKKEVEQLVKPLHETMTKLDAKVGELEGKRERAYGEISKQVEQLVVSQQGLQRETQNLVRALRAPAVRGRWGELQLKRVVELAGMLSHCDFSEQSSSDTDEGRLRPDLIVHLPGGKTIVVDAKTTLAAYLDSIDAPDDATRDALLIDHARQVRAQLTKLSQKAYFEQFPTSPEFVVLFLPAETFFSAALQKDPALIEDGVNQRVILATPTTLIALLRAVAYGWRQEAIAENAQEISATGRELYGRMIKFCDHLERVRKGLNTAVEAYNDAAGSLERRVLPQARKFKELGATHAEDLEITRSIDTAARPVQVPDLDASAGARTPHLAASGEVAPPDADAT